MQLWKDVLKFINVSLKKNYEIYCKGTHEALCVRISACCSGHRKMKTRKHVTRGIERLENSLTYLA